MLLSTLVPLGLALLAGSPDPSLSPPPSAPLVRAAQEPAEDGSEEGLEEESTGAVEAPSEAAPQGDLVVPSSLEGLSLRIPEKERLAFVVELNMAVIGRMQVGSFVITARTEAYRSGLPTPGQAASKEPQKRKGFIRAQARGGYMGYTLQHSIDARILPQKWPRVIVRDYQSGTENRRREVMYGERQGKAMSWYRRDRHCEYCERREHFVKGRLFSEEHHCNGCKRGEHRDWDAPKMQQVPPGALDMISAIFLARELVRTQTEAVQFPLLDKDIWWDMTMVLGERASIEVPAGKFACQAVKLDPQPPKGEEGKEEFKGLFGIHGTLSIWLHAQTGVPVMIEGIVPIGPLDLDVAIKLAQYSDTDKAFTPVVEASAPANR